MCFYRQNVKSQRILSVLCVIVNLCGFSSLVNAQATESLSQDQATPARATFKDLETLGAALYFDTNLSLHRNQSCATCHNPAQGFIDDRENHLNSAVSVGSDGKSVGGRNTPTASYAKFTPSFSKNAQGEYVGGFFYDGRAAQLKDQAAGPPLNPVEMAMPSKQAVLERLLENTDYVASFPLLFTKDVFSSDESAYAAMTQAIAAFERTELFNAFDSRYDRYLQGKETFTDQEKLGETLFFSQQFTNCNQCHQLKKLPGQAHETFTNYQYRNIGVPANAALLKQAAFIDQGLLDNPAVTDVTQAGKFKVPTLRNIAVTGPYMHNGVFSDLKTVVLFYDKYNSRKKARQINPETGEQWQAPEVADNIALDELTQGKALTNDRVDALVAFMKTLTDKKYEHLLDQPKK